MTLHDEAPRERTGTAARRVGGRVKPTAPDRYAPRRHEDLEDWKILTGVPNTIVSA